MQIFSHKNIFSSGIISLANSKGSYTHTILPNIDIFETLFLHDALQQYLGIQAKSLYDQIDSKLIGSNIYWKKAWQTAMIDKDDCTFSVVYSLLKIKSKANIFENIFEVPWNM